MKKKLVIKLAIYFVLGRMFDSINLFYVSERERIFTFENEIIIQQQQKVIITIIL
jgi:hypothetical protein